MTYEFGCLDNRFKKLKSLFLINKNHLKINNLDEIVQLSHAIEQWRLLGYIEQFDIMVMVER